MWSSWVSVCKFPERFRNTCAWSLLLPFNPAAVPCPKQPLLLWEVSVTRIFLPTFPAWHSHCWSLGGMPRLRQGFCAEEGGAACHCVTTRGKKWLQERAVVGQALQLCSRERWAGCLPQAGRSGKSKIHPVKQKVGELLLVVHEVRSTGTCCWASCWSGGSASAAGSAEGSLSGWASVFKGDVLRGEGWRVPFVSLLPLVSGKCLLC